jgi:hypothetical protein
LAIKTPDATPVQHHAPVGHNPALADQQQHGVEWLICEQPGRGDGSLPSEDGIDWHELVARFRQRKTSDTGECRLDSFDRNYGLKMQQFLEVVRRRPIPRDARTTPLASPGSGTSAHGHDHHALQDCTATRRSRCQAPGSSPTRLRDDGSHELCEPAQPR